MERRNFIKAAGALAVAPALTVSPALGNSTSTLAVGDEMYEWRTYTLNGDGQELDDFYKDILVPAYSRRGVTVGAFKPLVKGEQEERHILLIYPKPEVYYMLNIGMWSNAEFISATKAFYEATAVKPLYSNYETHLSLAFSKIPVHRTPDKSRGLFEIRIYWSPNEEANKRKVKMFNVDEIDIFDKVGVNSVLYGDILAGPKMPALMYLTWYQSEETRKEAWDKFGKHPDWLRIRQLPEYANTATNNKSILLLPLPYSQL